MANIAVPRANYNGEPIEEWLANNPQAPLPRGYRREGNRVVRDTHSWLQDAIKYAGRTAGIAGGIGAVAGTGAALPGLLGAGGGGAASIGTNVGIPTMTAAGPALTGGAAATGAAGAGGAMGSLNSWLNAGAAGVPLLGSLLSRGNDKPPQNDLMEELLRMQTSRMRQSDPLYQAVLRMAMGLLPRSAMSQPQGGQLPTRR